MYNCIFLLHKNIRITIFLNGKYQLQSVNNVLFLQLLLPYGNDLNKLPLQETYRRWACSTMVPLWVEEGSEDGEEGGRSRRAPAEHTARWHARHLERVGHLDRRRGGGVVGRWVRAAAAGPGRPIVRLKPCLSVCQLVEQHCPYFLPADRAPAYPTQYAGEPTFLCLGKTIFIYVVLCRN